MNYWLTSLVNESKFWKYFDLAQSELWKNTCIGSKSLPEKVMSLLLQLWAFIIIYEVFNIWRCQLSLSDSYITPGTDSEFPLVYRPVKHHNGNKMSLTALVSRSRLQQSYAQNVFAENLVYNHPTFASFQASHFSNCSRPYSINHLRYEFLKSLSRDQLENMDTSSLPLV